MTRILTAVSAVVAISTAVAGQAPNAATIRGHVLDDRGRPVPSLAVRVSASSAAETIADWRTFPVDRSGNFTASLASGQYVVVAAPMMRLGIAPVSFPMPGIDPSARPFSRVLRPGAPPVARTIEFMTDSSGRFVQFGGAFAMRDNRLFAYIPTFAGNTTDPARATRTVLAAGETKTIDIVIQSAPASLITGQLIGRVPGGVVNDAVVSVGRNGFGLPIAQAFTDFDGRFGIVALPAGDYIVTAHRGVCPRQVTLLDDGWPGVLQCDASRSDLQGWFASASLSLDDRGGLRIDGKDASALALEMTPVVTAPMQELGRRPSVPRREVRGTATLDGLLTDASGQPIVGARVAIFSKDLAGVRVTVTGDDGRFEFRELPRSSVRLVAVPPFLAAIEYGQRDPAQDGEVVTIPEGGRVRLDWRVATVAGIVTFGTAR